ncbi:MAG: exonuclease domain-containing protein [Deltaproteobacteria bacterium]|nr:exonuclease domain-containing protein [Deltaproteobacteria bacterium]
MERFFDYPYLLVIDLEATCDDRTVDRPSLVPKREMETIEIGAVLVETTSLAPVGELCQFVRPIRHPVLTPFCRELTTIRQADVDAAPRFSDAIANVVRFLEGRRALFCSWGDFDRNQLAQDASYHGIRIPFAVHHHLNLKRRFSEVLGLSKKLGMAGALRHVGLRVEGTHHRGIDDARNIARLLPWIAGRSTAKT